jgi:hypothetical protein
MQKFNIWGIGMITMSGVGSFFLRRQFFVWGEDLMRELRELIGAVTNYNCTQLGC